MSRLTNKWKNEYTPKPEAFDKNQDIIPLLEKLGKLEDLEEELGCPLEVMLKALKYGFYDKYGKWYKDYDFNLKYDWLLSNPNDKYLIFDGEDIYFELKLRDYKKTWWLKEDMSE